MREKKVEIKMKKIKVLCAIVLDFIIMLRGNKLWLGTWFNHSDLGQAIHVPFYYFYNLFLLRFLLLRSHYLWNYIIVIQSHYILKWIYGLIQKGNTDLSNRWFNSPHLILKLALMGKNNVFFQLWYSYIISN